MKRVGKRLEKKEILTEITKYLAIFLAFYVFSSANILGWISPFAFGLLFALMWCNHKVYILAPLYVVANFLATFDILSLYASFGTILVLLVTYLIHYRAKKRMNYWFVGIYAFISEIPYLCLEILFGSSIVAPILSVLIGVMFMFACIRLFEAVIVKGFAYRLSVDEIICAGVILVAFSAGVCDFSFGHFEVVKFFATIAILASCYCFNVSSCVYIAGIMGVGALFANGSPLYISAFVIWAMVVSCFTSFKTC